MAVVRDVPKAPATRVVSLDVVRGAVMVLMAIDHVRVYSGLPAGGPTAGIFFTRWVTHFCAPAFVFLAGTSAFLWGRSRPKVELARFLLTRGAWLVLLELTVIRVAWTFNFDFAHYLLLGVIWMIGWCMILMAAIVWLPTSAVGAFGLAVIAAQNVVGAIARAVPQLGPLWQVIYFGGVFSLGDGGPRVAVLYSIVPWIGVMAAGYACGAIVVREPAERRARFLRIGLAATIAFLIAGTATLALNPPPPDARPMPALFRLLNQQKYPASQLFLLMTLGPTIALLPILDRAPGGAAQSAAMKVLATFGRVPFFYYLLHIPTIHAAAVLVSLVREGHVNPWLFGNHPMMPPPVPPGYAWSLPLLYAVFAVVVAALYLPCAWFARVKAGHSRGLVHYL
jgi:uncharacterized membrane protein